MSDGKGDQWLGSVLMVGVLMMSLAGCTQEALPATKTLEVPIVTGAEVFSSETLEELRAWVGGQIDGAVAASGEPDGWYFLLKDDILWPADRDLLINGLSVNNCGPNNEGSVEVTLANDRVLEPFAASARVREFWEGEGWTVTNVLANPSPSEDYFRADPSDNDDSSFLTFTARENRILVSAYSRCSVDPTVVNWLSDAGYANVFEEELQRRETDVSK